MTQNTKKRVKWLYSTTINGHVVQAGSLADLEKLIPTEGSFTIKRELQRSPYVDEILSFIEGVKTQTRLKGAPQPESIKCEGKAGERVSTAVTTIEFVKEGAEYYSTLPYLLRHQNPIIRWTLTIENRSVENRLPALFNTYDEVSVTIGGHNSLTTTSLPNPVSIQVEEGKTTFGYALEDITDEEKRLLRTAIDGILAYLTKRGAVCSSHWNKLLGEKIQEGWVCNPRYTLLSKELSLDTTIPASIQVEIGVHPQNGEILQLTAEAFLSSRDYYDTEARIPLLVDALGEKISLASKEGIEGIYKRVLTLARENLSGVSSHLDEILKGKELPHTEESDDDRTGEGW